MSPAPDITALLGDGDNDADDKPSIGDALGMPPEDGDQSGTDVTHEAKVETGTKLLKAFESKDPAAMFDAVSSVVAMQGGAGDGLG